jgi:hypothetical protein
MFFGHIGVGLAAKRVTPKVPLGVLVPVALLPDILGIPGVLLPHLGFDFVPWTHGFFMSVIWSVTAGLVAALISRNSRASLVIGLLVLSHWVLDFISWPLIFKRGLPLLFAGSPEVGLGWYSTIAGSITGEIVGLLFVGVMIYILTRPRFTNNHD